MPSDIKDKDSTPIKEGDVVWTRIRGGVHEGEVRKIVRTEGEAKDEGVKNPPKVSRGSHLPEAAAVRAKGAKGKLNRPVGSTGSLHGPARPRGCA